MITEQGIHQLSSDVYHAHPALSSSGARKLLPPYCPALFKWHRENQQPPSRVFDFGHAAHKMVLGSGPELVIVEAKDYRTKAAQEARDETYADGKVPLLPHEFETVELMTAALMEQTPASMWGDGKPEQSLFARDEATGVMLRARIDWLPEADENGCMRVVDYKTTVCAEPGAFGRTVARYGYHQQAAFYVDLVLALGLAEQVEFVFVAQEKTPPYLVQPYTLDDYSLEVGRKRNRKAIDLFAECTERDDWPSYATGIETLTVPVWADDDLEIEL